MVGEANLSRGEGNKSFPIACLGLIGLPSFGGVLRGVRRGGSGGPMSQRSWPMASDSWMVVSAEASASGLAGEATSFIISGLCFSSTSVNDFKHLSCLLVVAALCLNELV